MSCDPCDDRLAVPVLLSTVSNGNIPRHLPQIQPLDPPPPRFVTTTAPSQQHRHRHNPSLPAVFRAVSVPGFFAALPSVVRQADWRELTAWVDPLDGTRELLLGNAPGVTVLVGLALRGQPVCGIVHQPFARGGPRTVVGIPGAGAFVRQYADGEGEPRPEFVRIDAKTFPWREFMEKASWVGVWVWHRLALAAVDGGAGIDCGCIGHVILSQLSLTSVASSHHGTAGIASVRRCLLASRRLSSAVARRAATGTARWWWRRRAATRLPRCRRRLCGCSRTHSGSWRWGARATRP